LLRVLELPELDRRFMPLEDAFEKFTVGNRSVVSAIPGQLAFYEGEIYPDEFIFQRATA
jgi:hypothetical protein